MAYNYDFVFDLDNCLIDSPMTIMNMYNEDNGTNHLIDYNKLDWDFAPYIEKNKVGEILKYFSDDRFYQDKYLVVFDNIIDVINELTEQGYKVAICSQHHPKRISNTLQWVSKVIPKVDCLFVDNFHEKGEKIGKCHIFFDDNIESLNSMEGHADYIVCVGYYNWNKNWEDIRQSPYEWNDLRKFFIK
nr:MAG TPA: 5' nucleotidase [Caudoviricetes sp.]